MTDAPTVNPLAVAITTAVHESADNDANVAIIAKLQRELAALRRQVVDRDRWIAGALYVCDHPSMDHGSRAVLGGHIRLLLAGTQAGDPAPFDFTSEYAPETVHQAAARAAVVQQLGAEQARRSDPQVIDRRVAELANDLIHRAAVDTAWAVATAIKQYRRPA